MSSILEIARKIQSRVPVPKIAAPHDAFCIGVDLAADFAAVCVLERLTITSEEFNHQNKFEFPRVVNTKKKIQRLICLQRLPSGYHEIIDIVSTILASLPEAQLKPATVVNVTHVGKPAAILMTKAGGVVAITATAGDAEQRVAVGEYRVPQKDLVGTLSVLMQSGRFRVSSELAESEKLISELGAFGGDGDGWKEDSENLCRSVCVAAWWLERMMPVPQIKFSLAR